MRFHWLSSRSRRSSSDFDFIFDFRTRTRSRSRVRLACSFVRDFILICTTKPKRRCSSSLLRPSMPPLALQRPALSLNFNLIQCKPNANKKLHLTLLQCQRQDRPAIIKSWENFFIASLWCSDSHYWSCRDDDRLPVDIFFRSWLCSMAIADRKMSSFMLRLC